MTTELALTQPPVDVDQLDTAKPLAVIFQPFQTTLEKWEAKAKSLTVTNINQKTEMQQARLARLELKDARVNMDKTRKGLVEGLKSRTSKIDETARVIRVKMEGLEAELLESEQFAERHAAKLKADLKLQRETELTPLLDAPIVTDLSSFSAEEYAKVLNDAKMLRQAKIDAAAKAEADRKAKEETDRIERERVEAENARLKAEAAEVARLAEIERQRIEAERAEERRKAQEEAARIAAAAEAERKRLEAERADERKKAEVEAARVAEEARKEREAIEAKAKAEADKAAKEAAKLKAELAAKAKAEAEQRAKDEAERKAVEDAKRAAAAAPDAAKLKAYALAIRQLAVPELSNDAVALQLTEQTEKFAVWVEAQIPKLSLL